MSYPYKICDPVHGFIRYDEIIQRVIDSRPFQRLRYIHQVGTVYLVYPGATHSRFEHSLGVMELVTRIYNTLIDPYNFLESCCVPKEKIDYWRLILRLAALCHDLGHLPFSHTAEKALLPHGGHEQMTIKLIQSEELSAIWREIGEEAQNDIIKLSVNERELKKFKKEFTLSPWERVLSQIITEDNFGADRIDYLLRDAHHAGVEMGRFDYHQLVDSLRILPYDGKLALGITQSGIQSVESLWTTRYMMYARVYQHPKSRVYSNHMNRFMCRLYSDGIPDDVEIYLEQTDLTVLSALFSEAKKGDYDAQGLLKIKKTFQNVPLNQKPNDSILSELQNHFNKWIFIDDTPQKTPQRQFPVLLESKKVISSFDVSSFLQGIPREGQSLCLYAHPDYVERVKEWLSRKAGPESVE
ncbi:MAG: HD domain-containing protein [Chlamydiales bacterium]